VANLHHQLANTVSHGTPFAELIPKDVLQQSRPAEEGDDSTEAVPESKRLTDWKQFYEGICSGKEANKGTATGTGSAGRKDSRPPSDLSERQRLEIALKMRGTVKTDRHKYCPNHEMMKETCMVLQTRAFRVEEGKPAIEAPPGFAGAPTRDGRGDESKIVVVREVAFGNDADPSVRGVALWFGVPSSEVISRVGTLRTNEERRNARTSHEAKTAAVIDKYLRTTANKPFYLVRPRDEDAFNLTTSILVHRLQTLQAVEMKTCKVQRDKCMSLNTGEGRIRSSFESLCRHWASGAWDATTGRPAKVEEETPRPRVDERYYQTKPKPTCASITGRPIDSQKSGEGHKTKMTSHVWDSFVQEVSTRQHSFSQKVHSFTQGYRDSTIHTCVLTCNQTLLSTDRKISDEARGCWRSISIASQELPPRCFRSLVSGNFNGTRRVSIYCCVPLSNTIQQARLKHGQAVVFIHSCVAFFCSSLFIASCVPSVQQV